MRISPEQYYQSPSAEVLGQFVNTRVEPPVNFSRLGMSLMTGESRAVLYTPTTGDMSLVLLYKDREGYLASMGDEGEELSIVQFQGANRKEGYRVATGLHLVRLFASQIHLIASHPDGPYRELYMPVLNTIEGLEVAVSDLAAPRYESLAMELGMKFSHQEQRFIKKTK